MQGLTHDQLQPSRAIFFSVDQSVHQRILNGEKWRVIRMSAKDDGDPRHPREFGELQAWQASETHSGNQG